MAVECDGPLRHPEVTDEDAARQAILERAGWSVVRIPYRGWHRERRAGTWPVWTPRSPLPRRHPPRRGPLAAPAAAGAGRAAAQAATPTS